MFSKRLGLPLQRRELLIDRIISNEWGKPLSILYGGFWSKKDEENSELKARIKELLRLSNEQLKELAYPTFEIEMAHLERNFPWNSRESNLTNEDVKYYSLWDSWDTEIAAALISGKNPKCFETMQESLNGFMEYSQLVSEIGHEPDAITEYKRLLNLCIASAYKDGASPVNWIRWAESKGYTLSTTLKTNVFRQLDRNTQPTNEEVALILSELIDNLKTIAKINTSPERARKALEFAVAAIKKVKPRLDTSLFPATWNQTHKFLVKHSPPNSFPGRYQTFRDYVSLNKYGGRMLNSTDSQRTKGVWEEVFGPINH